MQFRILAFFLTLLIVSACGAKKEDSSIKGTWSSIGYGNILKIDSTKYAYYDITAISCLPAKQGDIAAIQHTIKLSKDTLSVQRGFSTDYYVRAAALPNLCEQQDPKVNDPLYNFEVFATTYKNHYEYLELNGVNWDSLYNASKNKINAATTAPELYLILEEMLLALNDNHGSLEPSNEVYEAAEQLRVQTGPEPTHRTYGDFEVAAMVANHHLKENLTKDSWLIHWGKIEDNIGFIEVNAMMLFANLKLSDSLVQADGFVSAYFDAYNTYNSADQIAMEVAGVSAIMDIVMQDLADTQYLIIDVRFNGGGLDPVGLEILKRFNDKYRKVGTKRARHKDQYTKATDIFLLPAVTPYTKPVYLLTSQQSASATDMMALASMELKQLKRIGAHTNGAVSDALQKTLPNGWHFSLSNEVYTDVNGKCYENIGIPVDLQLDYPEDRQSFFRSVVAHLERDKQDILNAISALQNK